MKKKVYFLSILASLFSLFWFAEVCFAGLNDGLVASYPFSGNANDESGNGNNGIVYGATLTTDRFGNPNSAYYFNGIDSYIQTPKPEIYQNGNFTIAYWMKYEWQPHRIWIGYLGYPDQTICASGENNGLAMLINVSGEWGEGLIMGDTQLGFFCGDQTRFNISSLQGQWIHMTFIYDHQNNVLKTYVNGLLANVHNMQLPPSISEYPFYIGKPSTPYSFMDSYFKGLMDEIRIYNRALSESEIEQLYGTNYLLPDTGQTKCYDNYQEIPCPNLGELFHGQDANYQGAQPAYRNNGDGTVTDLVTGLIWQQKDDQNTVGRTWQEAADYCAGLNLRLPSVKELFGLMHLGRANFAIDSDYFPNARPGHYWSSTGGGGLYPWYVNFYGGPDWPKSGSYFFWDGNSTYKNVRCVGGGLASSAYILNSDGTVTDTMTGLVWQQSYYYNGVGWGEALSYCENLVFADKDDWRLPNIKELQSLVDFSRIQPSIDPVFSCAWNTGPYWSSTSDSNDPTSAWFINFSHGYGYGYYKGNRCYVRCVRDGNIPTPPQPTIAQQPFSGPPGTTFVQSGTGFTPNSTALLHFKKPDGTEYPTQKVQIDDSGHFEIPYLAPWNKPPGTYTWWGIDGPTKTKSNEVSYVIEGVAGQLHHFEFTQNGGPIGNQTINVAFPVTIQAKDYAGKLVTNFSGKALLSMVGPGSIKPTEIDVTGGRKAFNVTLGEASLNARIHCQSGTVFGDSNEFIVSGGTGLGWIMSSVTARDAQTPIPAATVKLATTPLGPALRSVQTSNVGTFKFSNVQPGRYYLWATYGDCRSMSQLVDVSAGTGSCPQKLVVHSKQRPVILVPGIMGSDKNQMGDVSPYPSLPDSSPAPQEKLHLHDYLWRVGWQELKNKLSDHYEVYDCPYDWRVSLKDVNNTYQKYLLHVIERAKMDTGWPKVDIVAHSMGGLLVRSYIQSEDYPENSDIEKFAMVGTPNHGSLNAYYIWEGGDSIIADKTCSILNNFYFYSNVANNIFKERYHVNLFYYLAPAIPAVQLISRAEARQFYSFNVPALHELMPTFANCLDEGGSLRCIENEKNKNQWLIDLNNDSRHSLMQDTGPIITKIFGSNGENTIAQINVRDSSDDHLYEDGEPIGTYKPKSGDGTVHWVKSAALSNITPVVCSNGSHASLIKECSGVIADFLDEGRTFAEAQGTPKVKSTQMLPSSILGMSIRGSAAPLLTDPLGKRCGVTDGAKTSYREIPNSEVVRDPSGGGITIPNPVDGSYRVTLTGSSPGVVFITLNLMTNGTSEQVELSRYYSGTPFSFNFTLTASSTPRIQVQSQPVTPQNLTATPQVVAGIQKVKLNWSPVVDSKLASYRIYTRRMDQPGYQLLATIKAGTTGYQTGHAWSNLLRIYAVSAVNTLGKESFLSNLVQNRNYTVADFSASPLKGKPPLTVKYMDTSLGQPTSWLWNFGDGLASTAQSPAHIYKKSGIYTPSLTVQGPNGTDSELKPGYIVVDQNPVISSPPTGPNTGAVDTLYKFIAQATDPDGDQLRYRFDWGDGMKSSWSSLNSASHKWAATGTFCVKTQAVDDKGGLSAWSGCKNIVIQ